MSWRDASALAVIGALEEGQPGVLDPERLEGHWALLAGLARETAPLPPGGALEFLRALETEWLSLNGVPPRSELEEDFWQVQQRLNGRPAAEYMRQAAEQAPGSSPPDAETTTEPVAAWSPPGILDGVDLDAPPPTPELLGLFYAGKLHLVSGRPETAKTWMALAAVIEAVRAGGAGLFVDTDGNGQRDIAARLLGMGMTVEEAARVGYSDDPRQLFADAGDAVGQWTARAAAAGPVVAVLDSINTTIAALGFTLDEAGMAGFENAAIAPLRRAGAAVVMVDHTAIHADADSPYSIGTQRKHAAADVHLRLTALGDALTRGGNPAPFLVRGMKDRPGGLERHGRQWHVGRITFTPGDNGAVSYHVELGPPTSAEQRALWRPTHLMERVSRWAETQPGSFSKRNAEAEVSGKAGAIRAAVDALYAEGYLTASGDRWKHAQPYRETDDPEAAE